jgi:hypothetical protein
MHTLSVPPYSQHWSEDGFVETETCSQETNVLKLFIHQPMHKWIVLKTILKFTLK